MALIKRGFGWTTQRRQDAKKNEMKRISPLLLLRLFALACPKFFATEGMQNSFPIKVGNQTTRFFRSLERGQVCTQLIFAPSDPLLRAFLKINSRKLTNNSSSCERWATPSFALEHGSKSHDPSPSALPPIHNHHPIIGDQLLGTHLYITVAQWVDAHDILLTDLIQRIRDRGVEVVMSHFATVAMPDGFYP